MTTTHLVRYAILGNQEDASDIQYAQIHEDEAWARTVARRLTKRQRLPMTATDRLLDAPFRVAKLTIQVDDPRDAAPGDTAGERTS